MTRTCRTCNKPFELNDNSQIMNSVAPHVEGVIYSFAHPTQCWSCRRMQRLAFKNERRLYRRKCDRSGEPIVSTYAPNFKAPVYKTGIDFNESDILPKGSNAILSSSLLDQYRALKDTTPKGSVVLSGCENCEYNNSLTSSKNCYLCFGSTYLQDCSYCTSVYNVKDSIDCFKSTNLELCFDSFWMRDSYNCRSCNACTNSQDLLFCTSCSGCKHCLGCYGLKQAKFSIFNQQYSEEEYFKKLSEFNLSSWSGSEKVRKMAEDFARSQPRRAIVSAEIEDCTGDYIAKSKNVRNGFSSSDNTSSEYLFECSRNSHVIDAESAYDCELAYSVVKGTKLNRCAFIENCAYSHDIYYSSQCRHSNNLILCVGLYRKEYCILNLQFTKDEYFQMLPKVIESLKAANLWGEFFPPSFSDFGFNESEASYHFPFEESSVVARGFKWNAYDPEASIPANAIPATQLPDSIHAVADTILDSAIISMRGKKAFKINRLELNFYRERGIPLPRLHPEERYCELLKLRNEPILFDTTCSHCSKKIQTTYPPGSPEILICDECYLNLLQ